ncbi:MAG: ATP-binding cassette domain-containing protein [Pseudoflavonifractor sp.]|nr:ATP-binding cassette domain-containing protein [Pseudoflavonifractor sp.]
MSIRFEDLEFAYFADRRAVLPGLTAEFDPGEITVLTGASGCGKSTLLYLAAGAYPHSAGVVRRGRVTVDGVEPGTLAPPERCKLVGMMFQNPELQFCMDTVKNELVFCLENIRTPPKEIGTRLDEALDFCGIFHLKERTLLSLSGGERQKVMLACLTALEPRWLLLDEPFANIDDASARAIAAKLRQLHRERGVGILAVDHRLDNWLEAADTVRVMEGGLVGRQRMEPARLTPETLEALGVIVPGRSYSPALVPAVPGEVVLELREITLSHQKHPILKGVNASFRAGCIYAVVGESGCGKSSLFGALSGLYSYKGQALLEGRELRRLRRADLGKLGFVTQNPQDQFVGDTVREEITVGLRHDPGAAEKSEAILRKIGLWRYRDISPYLLSQGQQRRLGVAALMAYPCKVLVCDEPTYAQDRNNTRAIMDALCRQAREHGVALLFSTHDRQLAKDYADEIWELREGALYANTGPGL